eukprot:788533-Pyramimonas_sp.AAC.1
MRLDSEFGAARVEALWGRGLARSIERRGFGGGRRGVLRVHIGSALRHRGARLWVSAQIVRSSFHLPVFDWRCGKGMIVNRDRAAMRLWSKESGAV